jgi:hypothetical protein
MSDVPMSSAQAVHSARIAKLEFDILTAELKQRQFVRGVLRRNMNSRNLAEAARLARIVINLRAQREELV